MLIFTCEAHRQIKALGKSEAHRGCVGRQVKVGRSSLEPGFKTSLLCYFFLLRERGNGTAEWGRLASLRKAICEQRKVGLCVSAAQTGDIHCARVHKPHLRHDICNNIAGNLLLECQMATREGFLLLPIPFYGREQQVDLSFFLLCFLACRVRKEMNFVTEGEKLKVNNS